MSHFILRSVDLEAPRRVASSGRLRPCLPQLQIEPGEGEFSSRTSIALAGGLVMADTAHSDCITRRTMALAAGTGDNHLRISPSPAASPSASAVGPSMRSGTARSISTPARCRGPRGFTGPRRMASISRSRGVLGAAGGLPLRDQVALTPQWRLLLSYARGIHAEAAGLSPGDLETCAALMQDLLLLAIGADRDTEQIAREEAPLVARLRAIRGYRAQSDQP